MTFKAYMDGALDRADCGAFIAPGNIVNTKGSTRADCKGDDDDDGCKRKKDDEDD
jgi:hypothetical protein